MVKPWSLPVQVVQTAMQLYVISYHVKLPFHLYNCKFRVLACLMSWFLSEDLHNFIHTTCATLTYTNRKECLKGAHSTV